MDGAGGHTSGTHGEDDGGSAADSIAAGKHTGTAGEAVGIGFEAAPRLGVKTGGGALDEGVGAGAEGNNHIVYFHLEVAAWYDAEFATAFLVEVAHSHADATHGAYVALLVA